MKKEMLKMSEEDLNNVNGGTIVPYVPKQGDTIDYVAGKFGVTVDQIAKWNGIKKDDPLVVGKSIEVRV